MLKTFTLQCFLFILFQSASAQITSYTWPTETGQALLSEKYSVFVKSGQNEEQELQVIQSNASWEGDWKGTELKGRTFSFANLSYDDAGDELTFRVVKKYGTAAQSASIHPKSYNLSGVLDDTKKEFTFSTHKNEQYISIQFISADNQTATQKWIKHMLCIFIDPPETDVPSMSAGNVVVYSKTMHPSNLISSTKRIIYFPAGYHNLKDYEYAGNGNIAEDGTLKLANGKSIYLEGGAFVEGLIIRDNYNNTNQKIYGRGILSGRQYLWHNHPAHTGTEYGQIVELGNNAQINGVTITDSPNHGIVGRTINIRNMKLIGWHSNNDAVRTGSGSDISHSFIRAVDDHFYNFDIYVHDLVLWAGHNGSIMTYGWGGEAGSNTYNSGSSRIENIDIIHPEWISLGNNNGLIMAQTGLDYKPYGYGGSTQTIFKDIRIEGSIPGITNLKPRSSGSGDVIAVQVPSSKLGYLGDLLLENVSVEKQFSKGRIKGKVNAASDASLNYYAQNITFKNVSFGRDTATEITKTRYFDIESATTKNIVFIKEQSAPIDTTPLHKDSLRIEAENYSDMSGIQSESTSDYGGGQNIGFIQNGDWCTYTVDIKKSGRYNVSYRLATASAGGSIELFKDENKIATTQINGDATNGWQDWYTSEPVEVSLPVGTISLKTGFVGETGFLFNMNWIQLDLIEETAVKAKSNAEDESTIRIYPNPARNNLFINLGSMVKNSRIDIYTIQGQKVYTMQTNGEWLVSINANELKAKGLFVVKISNNNAQIVKTIQIQ